MIFKNLDLEQWSLVFLQNKKEGSLLLFIYEYILSSFEIWHDDAPLAPLLKSFLLIDDAKGQIINKLLRKES